MIKINKIISEVFSISINEIKGEFTSSDLEAWDSLAQLNLIQSIESEYKINLDYEEMFSITKISDIYAVLEKHDIKLKDG